MKHKILLISLVTILMLSALSACHEGDYIVPAQSGDYSPPVEPAQTPEIIKEIRINTDLLDEFFMTFEEAEKKYGVVVNAIPAGMDFDYINANGEEQTFINTKYTYFFGENARGYNFSANEADDKRTLPGGIPVPKSEIRYQESGNLQVKDLFIGFEEPMTVEDFLKAIGNTGGYETTLMPTDNPWHVPFNAELFPFATGFWYFYNGIIGDFNIHIEHSSEKIITPDSYLRIRAQ
jgi:hypothetical protein